jgi:hypothetical protein
MRAQLIKLAFLLPSIGFFVDAIVLSVVQAQKSNKDYSHFTHKSHTGVVKVPGTAQTRELKCDSCHERRPAGTASAEIVATTDRNKRLRLWFPGHKACVDCHITQFTGRAFEACGICHAKKQALTASPPLRDFPRRYDYNVFFDAKQHEKHVTYAFAGGKKLDCDYCHKPTPRQAARLIPSHPECYDCHSPGTTDAKAALKSGCSVCHTQVVSKVSLHDYMSRAYGAQFTHQTHVRYVRGDCGACHTISGGYNQPQSQPGKITVKEHERDNGGRGCFSCHDGGTHYGKAVFSGNSSCEKCHTRKDFKVFRTGG